MDWTSGGPAAALIAARAVHFGATALLAGVLLFRAAVAGPAVATSTAARVLVDRQTRWIAGGALVAALASGLAWFGLTAAEMGNLPLAEALKFDVLQMILQGTQFGSVATVRLVLALATAVTLALDRARSARRLSLVAALMFAASIAWTGHSGSGFGASGNVQLMADALHLLAAGAWIGGLVPLALLLSFAGKQSDPWMAIARTVTQRFSILGIVSVATLVASGTANAWFLVGSVKALTGTEYGRVLMIKLVLFLAMLGIAAINRNVLTPRLAAPSADGGKTALRKLIRHCVYEIVLGFAVISVAGWLGTLHPAAHFMN
jgi:putative copper resistance protein D